MSSAPFHSPCRRLSAFIRSFLVGTLLAGSLVALFFHLDWQGTRRTLPPPPPLPLPGISYIGYYAAGEDDHSADFYLFHYGILGFREKMAQSDLLLLGSSRVVFGLSAKEVSSEVPFHQGRPFRVFNAAVLGGSIAGDADILRSNGLKGKHVLVDLYTPSRAVSDVLALPSSLVKLTALNAYWRVGKIWANFYRDYVLDPLFPNITFEASGSITRPHFYPKRFLQLGLFRNWNTGDATFFWDRNGSLYPTPDGKEQLAPTPPSAAATYPEIPLVEDLKLAEFSQEQAVILYTLIPCGDFEYERRKVPSSAHPYIPIPSDGLLYFDGSHLSDSGRKMATERFLEGWKKIFPSEK